MAGIYEVKDLYFDIEYLARDARCAGLTDETGFTKGTAKWNQFNLTNETGYVFGSGSLGEPGKETCWWSRIKFTAQATGTFKLSVGVKDTWMENARAYIFEEGYDFYFREWTAGDNYPILSIKCLERKDDKDLGFFKELPSEEWTQSNGGWDRTDRAKNSKNYASVQQEPQTDSDNTGRRYFHFYHMSMTEGKKYIIYFFPFFDGYGFDESRSWFSTTRPQLKIAYEPQIKLNITSNRGNFILDRKPGDTYNLLEPPAVSIGYGIVESYMGNLPIKSSEYIGWNQNMLKEDIRYITVEYQRTITIDGKKYFPMIGRKTIWGDSRWYYCYPVIYTPSGWKRGY